MTGDLEAIQRAFKQFETVSNKLERYESENHAIILHDNEPLLTKGENILRMYEGELQKVPDDEDVKYAMARHLFRIGHLYYSAIIPDYLPGASMLGRNDAMGKKMAAHAENACRYLYHSYQTVPNVQAAGYLGEMFSWMKFYWTNQINVVQ